MEINCELERPWLLTAIYGSPHFSPRESLWTSLQDLALGIDTIWVVLDDYNTTIGTKDRRGPTLLSPPHHDHCLKDLIDIGFSGDPFTWHRDGTWKRLDRAFINIEWRLRHLEAVVHHLPYFKSDHRPLLMQLDSVSRPNRHRRHFRFYTIWLTHGY